MTTIRTILGFALLALIFWLALQLALGLLGTLIGLACSVLVLAAMGYGCYVVLRIASPATAAKVLEAIRGFPANIH